MPSTAQARLNRLQDLLQALPSGDFESLVAALVSELLGVGIAVAKSGFQHGADIGPAGRQGRRFRIEAKRYADTSSLNQRELLGEVDQALRNDPALEAWFLAATRAASEQLELDLLAKSDVLGLPIVIIDWKPQGFPALAALCTASPQTLDAMVGQQAGSLARELAAAGAGSLAALTRDLESWNLGFARLRDLSQARLQKIWTDRRVAVSSLGQNVAGGAYGTTITRSAIHQALDGWWEDRAAEDAPALVLGSEGTGKTWATTHWLVDRADQQPLVFVVPSGTAAALVDVSRAGVKRFLGDRLYELAESRDPAHWRLRLGRLLQRPIKEGPVLTLVLDGLNQEPSTRWSDILKTLQDPEFAGRIRTIAVTRNLHFSERLKHLRALVVAPHKVDVGPYDVRPGGELDQRLEREGLKRKDLHPDLIELARTPRLFGLVVRLRERLVDGGQVTIHRLLWEYGRDTFGEREASFSEQDWRHWLASVAQNRLDGINTYNLGVIGAMVERPDLNESDVFRRLSDIVDGRFAAAGTGGTFTLSPTIVAHALGAALLERLRIDADAGDQAPETSLIEWLDPIAGVDERAEILRAAVSILLEGDPTGQEPTLGLLVREWLQSQNLPETHRDEIVGLAPALCIPLLDAVEETWGPARNLAIGALRLMPRHDVQSRDLVIGRCSTWLRTISRGVDPPANRHAEADAARAARLIARVGVDTDGERTVLGERLTFVERIEHHAHGAIPTLLQGYPLVPVLPVFSLAAFTLALGAWEEFWSGLKWLCLLNAIDLVEATEALRVHAEEIAARPAESGIHPQLATRIASLLLWLTGDEDLEAQAAATDPGLDRSLDYKTHYMSDPGRSPFALERRHAHAVLLDRSLSLRHRAGRVGDFLADPTFEPPLSFVTEIRAEMTDYDVSTLDARFSRTGEDIEWDDMVPLLAKIAPDLLAVLVHRKLDNLASRDDEACRIGLSRSTSSFLLANHLTTDVLQALTARVAASPDGKHEIARNRALLMMAAAAPPAERIALFLDQDAALSSDMAYILSPLTADQVDGLVARYRDGEKAANLVRLLSLTKIQLGNAAWEWLEAKTVDPALEAVGTAFRLLWAADAARFGRSLLARDWCWSPQQDDWSNHYGSLALAEAGVALPFDRTLAQIAPWIIPHAVVRRGGEAADATLAAEVLDGVVSLEGHTAPDLGSDVKIFQETRANDPEAFSLAIREDDHGGPLAKLKRAFDEEGRAAARNKAVPTALERLRKARSDGAVLFLHDFDTQDLRPIAQHAPLAVARWLEGVDEPGRDFKRRVGLAEGFYLALCEALLMVRPADGARLWRALRTSLSAQFIGPGRVDQLTLMLYRVASTPDSLRRDHLDLSHSHTDVALLDTAIASRTGGDPSWLESFIREEAASETTWRRQRARMLHGFHNQDGDAMIDAWPEGPGQSLMETRERKAKAWRRRDAWAQYWWRRYWEVETEVEAYAAWSLLQKCIDRRSLSWLALPEEAELRHPRRAAHYRLNYDSLSRAMDRAEKGLENEFLGRSTAPGLWPWG